ncbi:HET-domain-containing protein [Xylaria sp. CBS 124048]|nr:HET-domain-containing protein [Xylaria sp. CBS 124048]
MRLLNTRTIKLESFADNNVPAYPILSHTWGDDEILFEDVQRGTTANWRHKAGCAKVLGAADWARHMGYDYLWVDSCCIDKASSAELSEAINSMYKWYQQSAICFAYLSDVRHSSFEHDFPRSRWFTRGWTLQELIAPRNVHFYDVNWAYLGNRRELALIIEKITQINLHILLSKITLSEISVSCRMAWAAGRVTTRKEDEAYCLMGIFDVNMPLLYGEGDKAFRRLLEEIIRRSNDHTVLLCGLISDFPAKCAILAPNPTCFRRGREFIKSSGSTSSYLHVQGNALQLSVLMAPGPFGHDLAILDGSYAEDPTNLSRPALELGEYHGSYIRQNMDILKVTPVDGYSAKVKSESQT